MSASDDYPIDHLGDATDDRTIGELLVMRRDMCIEIDRLRAAAGLLVTPPEPPGESSLETALGLAHDVIESQSAELQAESDRIEQLEAEIDRLRAAAVTPEQRRLIAIGEWVVDTSPMAEGSQFAGAGGWVDSSVLDYRHCALEAGVAALRATTEGGGAE